MDSSMALDAMCVCAKTERGWLSFCFGPFATSMVNAARSTSDSLPNIFPSLVLRSSPGRISISCAG